MIRFTDKHDYWLFIDQYKGELRVKRNKAYSNGELVAMYERDKKETIIARF